MARAQLERLADAATGLARVGVSRRLRRANKKGPAFGRPRVDGLVRATQRAYRFTQYSTRACNSNIESHNGGEQVKQRDRGSAWPMLKHAEP